jgi:hypothetical protein
MSRYTGGAVDKPVEVCVWPILKVKINHSPRNLIQFINQNFTHKFSSFNGFLISTHDDSANAAPTTQRQRRTRRKWQIRRSQNIAHVAENKTVVLSTHSLQGNPDKPAPVETTNFQLTTSESRNSGAHPKPATS